jgi:hypothetical protein
LKNKIKKKIWNKIHKFSQLKIVFFISLFAIMVFYGISVFGVSEFLVLFCHVFITTPPELSFIFKYFYLLFKLESLISEGRMFL